MAESMTLIILMSRALASGFRGCGAARAPANRTGLSSTPVLYLDVPHSANDPVTDQAQRCLGHLYECSEITSCIANNPKKNRPIA